MTLPRVAQRATLFNDGTVLVTGRELWSMHVRELNSNPLAVSELYRPATAGRAPVLLSTARGQGAILHAGTAGPASAIDPAVPGELLDIYAAGVLDAGLVPPQVAIGGKTAELLWFGKAPGFDGLNQINVRVPTNIASTDPVSARFTYLSRYSNEVTIVITR